MWWPDQMSFRGGKLTRILAALALDGLTAGCFQPMYGTQTSGAGPAITDKLSSVEVARINAPNGTRLSRVGVEVRNALMYELTGGGPAAAAHYKLDIKLTSSNTHEIVAIAT